MPRPTPQANRPPRVPTQILYHGTSSTLLPAILAEGLRPDPPKRVWADDPAARERPHQSTRRSLKGVYLSSTLFSAWKGGYNAVRKLGGHRLLVIVKAQVRAAYADEDDIRYSLERAVEKWSRDRLGIPADGWHATYGLGFLYGSSTAAQKELEQAFVEIAHAEVTRSRKSTAAVPPATAALRAYLRAHLEAVHAKVKMYNRSHDVIEAGGQDRDGAFDWGFSDAASIDRYDVPQPDVSIDQAETDYLAALEALTRRYKQIVPDVLGEFTLRLNLPIGFRGQNRILMILEDRMDDRGHLIVHYGSTVPADFVKAWTKRQGSPPRFGKFVGKAVVPLALADDPVSLDS